jgi:hypothetical protein
MDFYLTTSASTFPRIKITWIKKHHALFVSPSFDANMPWRNTITRWLSDKCIMQDGNLATLELIKLLDRRKYDTVNAY